MFKEFRVLIRGIIEMTNEMRQKKQYGFLRDYNDRLAPEFFRYEIKTITF